MRAAATSSSPPSPAAAVSATFSTYPPHVTLFRACPVPLIDTRPPAPPLLTAGYMPPAR